MNEKHMNLISLEIRDGWAQPQFGIAESLQLFFFFQVLFGSENPKPGLCKAHVPLFVWGLNFFKGNLICIFQLLYISLIKMFNTYPWKCEKYFITFFNLFHLGKGNNGEGWKLYMPENVGSRAQNYIHMKYAVKKVLKECIWKSLEKWGKDGSFQ